MHFRDERRLYVINGVHLEITVYSDLATREIVAYGKSRIIRMTEQGGEVPSFEAYLKARQRAANGSCTDEPIRTSYEQSDATVELQLTPNDEGDIHK